MSQLISAALIFFIPLAPWFWLLLVIMFSKGLSDGMLNAGANTLLVWTHREKAGPFTERPALFLWAGRFLSPFSRRAADRHPRRLSLGVLDRGNHRRTRGAASLLFLPGSPKPAHTHTDENGAPTKVFYPLVIMAALYLFFYVGARKSPTAAGSTHYATTLNISSAAGAAYSHFRFLAVVHHWAAGLHPGRHTFQPCARSSRRR